MQQINGSVARMSDDGKKAPVVWGGKSKGIQNLLSHLFPKAKANIDKGLCAECGSDKVSQEDFKNDTSIEEFTLTGWCQKCQDAFFK